MYLVHGGVYTSTDFQNLVPGTKEVYGPFDNYQEAYMTWAGKARANIDVCCHRLVIEEA